VIGGVTLAFMGLTYYLLPLINREVYLKNVSKIQPYLYGVGVLIFSLGLYWAGSHGVPRKTFGPAQNLDTYSKLSGMALMGIGGIVAISGGATFVINAVMSLFMRRSPEKGEEKVYAEELSFDI
jgi:heme/copper-type cytochrome/quinol oxidase subunit 1